MGKTTCTVGKFMCGIRAVTLYLIELLVESSTRVTTSYLTVLLCSANGHI